MVINMSKFKVGDDLVEIRLMTSDFFNFDAFNHIRSVPVIKKVIFNNPATIVFWSDGTKTVVKFDDNHDWDFDPEKGLAMAIAKKALGNNGAYYNEFKKWLPKEGDPIVMKKGTTK